MGCRGRERTKNDGQPRRFSRIGIAHSLAQRLPLALRLAQPPHLVLPHPPTLIVPLQELWTRGTSDDAFRASAFAILLRLLQPPSGSPHRHIIRRGRIPPGDNIPPSHRPHVGRGSRDALDTSFIAPQRRSTNQSRTASLRSQACRCSASSKAAAADTQGGCDNPWTAHLF